jgi:hypothetical protein
MRAKAQQHFGSSDEDARNHNVLSIAVDTDHQASLTFGTDKGWTALSSNATATTGTSEISSSLPA